MENVLNTALHLTIFINDSQAALGISFRGHFFGEGNSDSCLMEFKSINVTVKYTETTCIVQTGSRNKQNRGQTTNVVS